MTKEKILKYVTVSKYWWEEAESIAPMLFLGHSDRFWDTLEPKLV
jgi:hypothetical protein